MVKVADNRVRQKPQQKLYFLELINNKSITLIVFAIGLMHLRTFTSVITLLMLQNPQLAAQLDMLKSAIIQWYEGVQQQLMEKNKMLLAARARGTQKLAILFGDVDNYFHNLLKAYSDPNLPVFYKMFLKIKQEFEFIDIDFGKFAPKFLDKQIQTDRQTVYVNGVDFQKYVNSLEAKQTELEQARVHLSELEDDNQKLRNEMTRLIEHSKKDSDDNYAKIKQLMESLQKAKAESLRYETQKKQLETEKKNYPIYRSNPEIALTQILPHKGIIKNLLQNAYYQELKQNQNNTSIEEVKNQSDPEYMRIVLCQALALEGILQSIAAKERAQN